MDIKIINSQARHTANQRTGDSGAKVFSENEKGVGRDEQKSWQGTHMSPHGTEKAGRTSGLKQQQRRKAGPHRVRGRTVGKQASMQESDERNVWEVGRVLALEDTSERDCGSFPDDATKITESTVEVLGEKFRESGGKSPMSE